jgi:hypothetical protein
MFLSRLASVVVAAGYIIAAGLIRGWAADGMFALVVAAIFPLPFIWFGEALGGYAIPTYLGYLRGPTPGIMIIVTGWLILLAVPPLLIWLGM